MRSQNVWKTAIGAMFAALFVTGGSYAGVVLDVNSGALDALYAGGAVQVGTVVNNTAHGVRIPPPCLRNVTSTVKRFLISHPPRRRKSMPYYTAKIIGGTKACYDNNLGSEIARSRIIFSQTQGTLTENVPESRHIVETTRLA